MIKITRNKYGFESNNRCGFLNTKEYKKLIIFGNVISQSGVKTFIISCGIMLLLENKCQNLLLQP
jgi:hypothetical protein